METSLQKVVEENKIPTQEEHTALIVLTLNRLYKLTQLPCSEINDQLIPTIHIKARVKNEARKHLGSDGEQVALLQEFKFFKAIPAEMAEVLSFAIKYCWEWYTIYNTCEIPSDNFTKQERIALQNIKHVAKNRIHEKAYILLQEEQVVCCVETGISYIVKLPAPAKLNLETLHPFSFYNNVDTVIRSYYKTGLKLESELQPQVLAGMLISLLRHKELLVCKDIKKANLFLQQATSETLSYAIRYFYNLSSSMGKPRLSLNLEDHDYVLQSMWKVPLSDKQKHMQEAEIFILNYIRACKGETVEDRAILPAIAKSKKTVKAKIFTDKTKQEFTTVKNASAEAIALLDNLPQVGNQLILAYLKNQAKILEFLSDKARNTTASKIIELWANNEDAHKVAKIFKHTSTKTIQDDLLSFSQSVETEKVSWQDKKKQFVDFTSLITSKNRKVN